MPMWSAASTHPPSFRTKEASADRSLPLVPNGGLRRDLVVHASSSSLLLLLSFFNQSKSEMSSWHSRIIWSGSSQGLTRGRDVRSSRARFHPKREARNQRHNACEKIHFWIKHTHCHFLWVHKSSHHLALQRTRSTRIALTSVVDLINGSFYHLHCP